MFLSSIFNLKFRGLVYCNAGGMTGVKGEKVEKSLTYTNCTKYLAIQLKFNGL